MLAGFAGQLCDKSVTPPADVYSYNPTPLAYAAAEGHCVSLGGHLATVTNAKQSMDFYNTYGKAKGKSFWIGLNDKRTENHFIWTDGSSSSYKNWASSEPNNMGNEDCVYIGAALLWGFSQASWSDKWVSRHFKPVSNVQRLAAKFTGARLCWQPRSSKDVVLLCASLFEQRRAQEHHDKQYRDCSAQGGECLLVGWSGGVIGTLRCLTEE